MRIATAPLAFSVLLTVPLGCASESETAQSGSASTGGSTSSAEDPSSSEATDASTATGEAASSSGGDVSTPFVPELEGFAPQETDRLAVAAPDVAQDGDIVNDDLPAGMRVPLIRYEVEAARCVRPAGLAVEDLPTSQSPGEPGVFYVAVPEHADVLGAVAYVPHGNSLEFAESLVVYAANTLPGVLPQVGIDPSSPGGYGNQLSQSFADLAALSEFDERRTAGFLAQGAVVVSPGNCWGDLGLGNGEVVKTHEYEAPRYGRVFDTDALRWTLHTHGEPTDLVLADGCSGGGSRIGQQLQHNPQAFDAAVIDSPADDVGGFVREPYGELIGYAYLVDAEFTDIIMSAYVEAFGGSAQGLAEYSLGHRLGRDVEVTAPILFGYSQTDPLTPPPITDALREALTDDTRYAHPAAQVVEGPDPVHCQFWNGDESLGDLRMQWWDARYAEFADASGG